MAASKMGENIRRLTSNMAASKMGENIRRLTSNMAASKMGEKDKTNVRGKAYTTHSCKLCPNVDTDEMVQCDECDLWYHFKCVNVTSDVEFREWICGTCLVNRTASNVKSTTGKENVDPSVSQKSSRKSLTRKQRISALRKLEEEQAIRLECLNKKYRIIESTDDEDDTISLDKTRRNSMMSSRESTKEWAQEVQNVSKNLSRISFRDNLSKSASDHDRDEVNGLTSDQLKDNVLPVTNRGSYILRPSLLSTNNVQSQSLGDEQFYGDQHLNFNQELVAKENLTASQQKVKFNPRADEFKQFRQPNEINSNLGPAQNSSNVRRGYDWSQYARNQYPPSTNVQEVRTVPYYQRVPASNLGGSTTPIFGMPPSNSFGMPPSNTFGLPSTPNLNSRHTNFPHQVAQQNFGVNPSGYVSNPPGQLTSNQIASRHVFKELPEFYGNPEEWPVYLSALKTSTAACGYTDGENLGRLQRSLKGDVMNMFRCRLVHAESVPGVVETLHLMFGRPGILIHRLLEKISETPSPQSEDLGSLIKFAIAVQNLCTTIESSNDLVYLQNPILIQTVIDKADKFRVVWDETLPIELQEKWTFWLNYLPQVERIYIPRLYSTKISPTLPESIQLHVFVDAGLEAYAAVAYFRIQDNSGVDSCLVEAKSRVAPIKPMSVPRLELQGGVLGTRLAQSIIDSHSGFEIDKIILWCDSRTVLSWINSDLRKYSQFVSFRVCEILDSPLNIEWRWIPSNENVADEATKSKKNLELSTSSRWFQGPDFLRNQDPNWTFELDEPEFRTIEELRPMYLLSHLEIPFETFIDFTRFSNWNRLVRTMAYVFRFINNLKSKPINRHSGVFSSDELRLAESFLFKKAQYDTFGDELAIVRHNEKSPIDEQKDFPKNSVIRTCSAYLDENGVMKVRGRIDAATSISETMKRPIIMDRHHYLTQLIVDFYHRKYKHLNHHTVLNEVRQVFYIPKLRVLLGQIRKSCQKCKNCFAKPKIPEMAPLPEARLAVYMRPFTYVGVDYFGPIKVVHGRGTVKRWGVLFTCLTIRAIHLEIAHSLDTSSCIMAIYNFIGRRGQPKAFHSDNGTNFHGADNTLTELREEFKQLNQDRIQEEFTTSEFTWTFNPPVAPHMGGSWERMIQIVKKCLDESMTSRIPTDEVLKSLFVEAENIVNSRPLTYVTLDSPHDEVLTPNHFLLGSSNGYKPPHEFTDTDLLRNSWRTSQVMADKFWNAFVMEYLPTVIRRTKWLKQAEALKVDDVVLIVDSGFKRNTWPKGLVAEVHADKHGIIRSAQVRTALGTFLTRPVSQLVVLNVRKDPVQQVVLDVKLRSTRSVNEVENVGQR